MSRLTVIRNLVAGPLANVKAVCFPFLRVYLHFDYLMQYARNIYETEPAIAWSFTIGLAG
jgi:hypothetical protein